MDRKQLTALLNNQTRIIWDNLCEIHPRLSRYNPPIIELNGRLWRVAGLAHQESNIIELGYKFFAYSPDYANNMVKYMPIDKSSMSIISPIFDFIKPS